MFFDYLFNNFIVQVILSYSVESRTCCTLSDINKTWNKYS